MQLTKRDIERANKRRKYSDGRGLFLSVSANGRKTWAFCYTLAGRAREMGLGSIDFMSVDEARDRAVHLRSAHHQQQQQGGGELPPGRSVQAAQGAHGRLGGVCRRREQGGGGVTLPPWRSDDPDVDTLALFVAARVEALRNRHGRGLSPADDAAERRAIMADVERRLARRYLRHLRAE